MPTPTSLVAAQAGETWAFQAWHRDFTTAPPFAATSNFTEGVEILFQ